MQSRLLLRLSDGIPTEFFYIEMFEHTVHIVTVKLTGNTQLPFNTPQCRHQQE